ncbi:HET-domain-containing protein, partial [Melanomma pulvis-pyrius CBS 109.77]
LKQCERYHPRCCQYKVHGYPTRLLQIEMSGTQTSIRLFTVESASFSGNYAALSHRWGPPSSVFSTTKSKLARFQNSIPVSQLPKTFLDAIEITKALGLAYLWIDSLCIIQDSRVDWETESAKMDKVYLNAAVTIAASSSGDTQGGCFLDLVQPASRLPDCPLNKRGWVFQEMVLSSRILHFTQDQVYWQCRETMISNRFTFAPNMIPDGDLPLLWWSWAVDYSSRVFTKPEDRLYAYAGITKFYERLSGSSTIVLGLLRERLPTDLHWSCRGDKPRLRITTTNLPSWTW